tara:strand:+ start:3801 stop:4418 length:618 start_codon:yes stop_codon:yes gene_type:complete
MIEYKCGPTWDRRIVTLEPAKKVALLMSGGIDSLVLYHLLSRHTEVKVYTADRGDGFDTPLTVAEHIGEWPNTINVDPSNPKEMLVKAIQHIRGLDIYLGLNVQPPIEHFPQFDIDGRPYRPFYIPFKNVKAPFLHMYKYHIIDLAHKEGIDISESQSCLHFQAGHCSKCWQCREITWAFDMLRKEKNERPTTDSSTSLREGQRR